MSRNAVLLILLLAVAAAPAAAQDWYFAVNAGSLTQSFTARQLEPGFRAASIDRPRIAARVVLVGRNVTPWLAAQITYMRPVRFVSYADVNGDGTGHHVWTAFGGASLKARAPIASRTSIYGEAGLGIASRHGFSVDGSPVVADASHAAVLLGAGVEYRVRPAWDLIAGATIVPGRASDRESAALMIDGGFRYTIRRQTQNQNQSQRQSFGPDNRVQVEYTTAFGYSINTFLSTKVPVFWKGDVQVDRGFAVHATHSVFHSGSLVSIEAGASASVWRTRGGGETFYTLSGYPLFRFTPIRTRHADAYFFYSLAGPTFISSDILDRQDLGSRFTFQDFLGGGVLIGPHKRVAVGVKINHYSNGNIFPENAGVMVPVTMTIGWVF